jgi:hypothetical protein
MKFKLDEPLNSGVFNPHCKECEECLTYILNNQIMYDSAWTFIDDAISHYEEGNCYDMDGMLEHIKILIKQQQDLFNEIATYDPVYLIEHPFKKYDEKYLK